MLEKLERHANSACEERRKLLESIELAATRALGEQFERLALVGRWFSLQELPWKEEINATRKGLQVVHSSQIALS